MRASLLLLVACASEREQDQCGARDGVVVATSDFTVGALATLGASGRLVDRIATVSGDPLVRFTGGSVYQANRSSADTLRRYAPGEFCRPQWEVALEAGSNVHDVHAVGGELLLTAYERTVIDLRGAEDGKRLGSIDARSLADDDGLPELHDVIEVDGRVYVGAQRLDRTVLPWRDAGGGLVAELDLERRTIGQTWSVGPNPRLYEHPNDPTQLLLLTGVYGQSDGALSTLDPVTGEQQLLVSESELQVDFEGVSGVGTRAVLLASELDLAAGGDGLLYCVDLESGEFELLLNTSAWFVDAAASDGVVIVGARRGWGADTEPGLLTVDPLSCSIGDKVRTSLEPYSLTAVDDG